MTATITLHTTDAAADLADYLTDTLSGGTIHVAVDGTTITLTAAALDRLADLPDDCDGHYDGQYIWIGGTEHPVSRA